MSETRDAPHETHTGCFFSPSPCLPPFIGLAKKFVWVFHKTLQKNPNELFGQPNISSLSVAWDKVVTFVKGIAPRHRKAYRDTDLRVKIMFVTSPSVGEDH